MEKSPRTKNWIVREKPIIMDRQKNQLQHNVTGRKCGGDVRRLAGLLWAAGEGQEAYFSGQGVLPEKCGV